QKTQKYCCSTWRDPSSFLLRRCNPRLGRSIVRLSKPTFLIRTIGGFMNLILKRRVQVGGLVLGSVMVLTAADTGTLSSPPVAKKVPHVSEVNGHKMVDNYFWLRDKPNPEVRTYLEAENAYTEAVMKPTEAF